MSDEIAVAATAAPATGLARRAAVTIGVVAVLLAARWVELPLVDPEALRQLVGPVSERDGLLSPVALGLWPFLYAYVIVEAVALAHPGLRRLRNGPARDRLPLTRFAWGAAVLLAAIQGWGIAKYLQSLGSVFAGPVLEPGPGPAAVVALTLVAGSVATAWAATLISTDGVGNGFAVLLAADAILTLARVRWRALVEGVGFGEAPAIMGIALLVVVPLVVARLGRESTARGMPLLACGIVPLAAPWLALWVLLGGAAVVPALAPVADRVREDARIDVALQLVAVAASAALLARLFCAPAAVAAAFGRATRVSGGLDPAEAARGAVRRSVALVVGLAAIPAGTVLLELPIRMSAWSLVTVATVIAVAADLRAELRARAAMPALVCARPIHRVYAVAPALAALAGAGIPAFARARHYRGLFHVFAPWAPVEILVPPERVADADAICEHVEAGEGSEPLAPTSP